MHSSLLQLWTVTARDTHLANQFKPIKISTAPSCLLTNQRTCSISRDYDVKWSLTSIFLPFPAKTQNATLHLKAEPKERAKWGLRQAVERRAERRGILTTPQPRCLGTRPRNHGHVQFHVKKKRHSKTSKTCILEQCDDWQHTEGPDTDKTLNGMKRLPRYILNTWFSRLLGFEENV